MSGTSLDGLDIAYVEIYKYKQMKFNLLKFETIAYPKNLKNRIYHSFSEPINSRYLCSLNFEIANFYADAINKFLNDNTINKNEIDYIASHGQTIYHLMDPCKDEAYSTLQLGDISVIAQKTGITTIGDFRPADIANDGKGAPLVPYPDYLLFRDDKEIRLLQNIGGIGNVTVLDNDYNNVIAFDTGPGNVLIDMACKYFFNQDYDKNAILGEQGVINNKLIDFLKNDKFYQQKPPKATGREKYSQDFFNTLITKFPNINGFDFIASLTYFTAYTISESYKNFIIQNDKKYAVYLSGGGARNPLIKKFLSSLLNPIVVKDSSSLGMNVDAKEAISFAILGYLTLKKQPSNLPKATGANKPVILGKIAWV